VERALLPRKLSEAQWQAVIHNNEAYDGQFVYAVRTTRIFCRPSCKSRPPKQGHVGMFRTPEEALLAGYRPCKRCKPTGGRLPDEEWIAEVTAYIDRNYAEPLTLQVLADVGHGSPYHLHRTFRKVLGMTPVAYIHRTRIERAKLLLLSTDKPVMEIGLSVGMPNLSYFITLFKKKTGRTPAAYRQHSGE